MFKLSQINLAIILLASSASGIATAENVTVSQMLDLETKVTVSKMKEELAKVSAQEVSASPPKMPETPKIQVATPVPRVISIFGVTPNYQSHIEFGGNTYAVKKGSLFNGMVVTDVTAAGVTVQGKDSRVKKVRSKAKNTKKNEAVSPKEVHTTFYPLVSM